MKDKYCSEVLVEGISVPVGTPEGEVLAKAEQRMKRGGISVGSLHFRLYKRSVDARKREDIRLVYTVLATVPEGHLGIPEERILRAGFKPHSKAA